ncbi:putative proteasome endopeptidase complex [Rosa chinensis]|uniref:Putative proteasome endopeptidase complex n=1 Tax=Rosa chinensis TaxID=74649 RepID=A0A2P6QX11_ROSCH|nr:putative proteasome endopeptidase complex [Rosa chinensis]
MILVALVLVTLLCCSPRGTWLRGVFKLCLCFLCGDEVQMDLECFKVVVIFVFVGREEGSIKNLLRTLLVIDLVDECIIQIRSRPVVAPPNFFIKIGKKDGAREYAWHDGKNSPRMLELLLLEALTLSVHL